MAKLNNYRIVYFHYAGPQLPDYYNYKSYLLSAIDLQKLIRFYKKKYKIISISEAIERLKENKSLNGYLSISTDDGLKENHSVCAPIFIEEKVPATIFISTDAIDNQKLLWNNKVIYIYNTTPHEKQYKVMQELSILYNIKGPMAKEDAVMWSNRTWNMSDKEILADQMWERCVSQSVDSFLQENKPYLTADQIRELNGSNIEIGSHSKSHPFCNKLNYKDLETEVFDSISKLENIVKREINLLAYPYGRRPSKDFENKLLISNNRKLSSLLGIKNKLENGNNPYQWERDRQEFSYRLSLMRLFLVPIIRSYIK